MASASERHRQIRSCRRREWIAYLGLAYLLLLPAAPAFSAPITFTVNASEQVTVSGTPRIAINIGGVTRYAGYSGAQNQVLQALPFTYAVQAGDFDPDGISIDDPQLDLNGAAIGDPAGNPLSSLTFVKPTTSNIKVQTYAVAFTSTADPQAFSFTISKAPTAPNASFEWSISSSGGAGTVGGAGTFSGLTQTVSGIDVSALPLGTLTLSVTAKLDGVSGQPKLAFTVPAFTGPLDSVTAPAAAYAVRRLRSAYSGPLIRLRRSTDSREQDIGATVGGDLDTAAVASFCGQASCYVRTWYDQGPVQRDMQQPAAVNQPALVLSGVVQTEGGRPALRFTSSAGQLLEGPVMTTQTLTASINAVARCTDTTVNRHVMGDRGVGPAMGRIMRALSGGASYLGANIGGATVTLPGSTTQQRIITIISNNSGLSGALDGVLTTGGTSTIYQTSTYPYRIGGGGAGQGGGDWVGTISEVTLFNFPLASARQTLERSQGTYYGISVP